MLVVLVLVILAVIERLTAQRSSLRDEVRYLTDRSNTLERQRDSENLRAAELTGKNEELKGESLSRLAALDRERETHKKTRESLNKREEDLDGRISEVNGLRSELGDCKKAAEAQVASHEKEMRDKDKELGTVKSQLAEARGVAAAGAKSIEELNGELATAKGTIAVLTSEKADLEKKLSELRRDHDQKCKEFKEKLADAKKTGAANRKPKK